MLIYAHMSICQGGRNVEPIARHEARAPPARLDASRTDVMGFAPLTAQGLELRLPQEDMRRHLFPPDPLHNIRVLPRLYYVERTSLRFHRIAKQNLSPSSVHAELKAGALASQFNKYLLLVDVLMVWTEVLPSRRAHESFSAVVVAAD